ncbi:O-antigen/teichoic acid export membrane protein [Roseivirga pacifica]|uniref:Membrane protein involved in the export of O-antigen and teichoic acid n=1 Tax=Roseivirga pacifica TaxID=1267423 RepID=A0A1I0RBV6_9BACT|nr:polysaccharide biosynthesis C-terminal domain-containing protein [Roseivirga pacifica]RKQ49361.1 O-antigen/teichoic acid export membrane protein [Roseivirga pacifica]SEW38311.1 Membrane protein involved in the export of O-antigen and teichoic acid [Roseivirga pacifica]
MGIIIKQSIRSSIFSYLGVAIGYINVLWLYPYFLSADQIGLFRLIQSSAYLLATFGQIGLASSLVKFYPTLKKEKGFLTLMLLGSTVGFLLIAGLSILFQTQIVNYFAQESSLFVEYFQLTLMVTFFLVIFQVLEAYCRSLLSITLPTFLRDIGIRILTMLFVLLYAFDLLTFEQLTWSFILVYGLVTLALLARLVIKKEAQLSFQFGFLNSPLAKQILNFGLYALLGAGGTQIILQIDSIMVSGELGLEATGIYTIAFFIGTVIEMPKRAISQLSLSLMSQSFKKNDMEAVEKLYRQTSINQLIIGALLLLGIWANLENIYHFVPNGEVYKNGFYVVLFIGLGKLSDMIFGANGEIIVMSKYFRFNVLAVTLLALATIGLNSLLIPTMGIQGAALASLLAMLGFNLTKYFFVWIKFGLQPFDFATLKAIAIIAATYFLNETIPLIGAPLVDLLVRSTIIATVFLALIISFKVSEEINGLFKKGLEFLKLRR